MDNLVSVKIPADVLSVILQKLDEIDAALMPYLVTLTPEERKRLPKMSERNASFTEKALEYMKARPELNPAFVNTEEMEVDLKAVHDLLILCRHVDQLYNGLHDTMLLSGSEAYVAALSFYNNVKTAARRNVKGAEPIYDDLKKRFIKHGSRSGKKDIQES